MQPIITFFRKNLLLLLIIFPLLLTSIAYLQIAWSYLHYPYSILAGLEDENLARSLMVFQGKSLYPSLTGYPFMVTLYPPVFYYFGALFVKFFGPTLFAGRLLSFIGALLISFFCFLIGYFISKKILIGMLAGCFFLVSGYVQWWGIIFKNDMLAVLFSLLGIYIFLKFEKSHKTIYAIPFLLLAFFTKQTAISSSLAVIFYLFFTKKDLKEFFYFVPKLLIALILVFILLTIGTNGQFFIDTILVPKIIPWNFSIFETYFTGALKTYGYLLFPAMGYLFYDIFINKRISLISWFFIFSLLARYDMGIEGSGNNYFIETAAVSGVLTSLFLSKINVLPRLTWFLIFIFFAHYESSSLINIVSYLLLGALIITLLLLKYKIKIFNLLLMVKKWRIINNLESIIVFFLILTLTSIIPPILKQNIGLIIVSIIILKMIISIKNKTIFNNNKSIVNYMHISSFFYLIFVFMIWQKYTAMTFPEFSLPVYPLSVSPPSSLAPYQKEIDLLIKNHPGRVLIDSESYLAIKNNRSFEYIPIGLKLRNEAGYWNFKNSLLYKDISKQKFRYYIKSQGWTDSEIMSKIYEHYSLTGIINAGAFFYEIFEPENIKYKNAVSEIRKKLDETEKKDLLVTEIIIKKLDKERYLVGFSFASDIYGKLFMNIVNHPKFEALYRPLHTKNPDSSVIFKAKSNEEIRKIIQKLFTGPEYKII